MQSKPKIKLNQLSPILVKVIGELIKNQNICKYLYYNEDNPLEQSDLSLPMHDLVVVGNKNRKIFPYPFNPNVSTDNCSQIRLFYDKGEFKGRTLEFNGLFIDIIVAKDLWLIRDVDSICIRPYEILSEIVSMFHDKDFGIGTKINFQDFGHVFVNDHFDCIRVITELLHFKSGKR